MRRSTTDSSLISILLLLTCAKGHVFCAPVGRKVYLRSMYCANVCFLISFILSPFTGLYGTGTTYPAPCKPASIKLLCYKLEGLGRIELPYKPPGFPLDVERMRGGAKLIACTHLAEAYSCLRFMPPLLRSTLSSSSSPFVYRHPIDL